MSIPLGVSQVVSYYKEWWKSGGRGWSNRILSSQLQFLESYKPMRKLGQTLFNNVMDSFYNKWP